MPEYLAPGVYVEETSFRQKSIEGVSTSTCGFVGPTRFGPISGEPELLTSFLGFERIYGGIDQLDYGDPVHNDLAHAVRGFFENGGRRLYVARTFAYTREPEPTAPENQGRYPDFGVFELREDVSGTGISLRARWPGADGNFIVTFDVKVGPNILVQSGDKPVTLSGAIRWDTVLVRSGPSSQPDGAELYVVDRQFHAEVQEERWRLVDGSDPKWVSELDLTTAEVRVVTVTVTINRLGRFVDPQVWENLNPDPRHRTNGLTKTFAEDPPDRATSLYVPLVISFGGLTSGATIVEELFEGPDVDSVPLSVADRLDHDIEEPETAAPVRVRFGLEHGTDGRRPDAAAYQGEEKSNGDKSALLAFEDLEDISIVAAPGSSRDGTTTFQTDAESIVGLLISHAERMWYRIAVLDAPDAALVSDVRGYRAKFDSKHAAFYYPWITIADPITGQEITTPPSGFVAGIYARNDIERGVHKAPANEVVRLAIDFELPLNKGQQDVLNPEGINCLRFFEGRGFRVWGARTISSDPEWKYLNLRRYFAFIERSIEKGTQWAVFEPNGSALWANVRRTIEDFLFNEFKSGHLLGDTVDEAYFVKCDRTTMTQNDLDNGRLICLVGIAPLRPAEFVIFRIGQKTLDFKG
jgi:phage tail sheath protein FI